MNKPVNKHASQWQLIVLDRDGVVNHDSDDYIKSIDEWVPIPGALKAIAKLHQAHYKIAIASNQSGVARGYFSIETLQSIHAKLQNLLMKLGGKIDYIAYCTDHPNNPTPRRKPGAGMLQEISEKLAIPLSQAIFIGDSYSDYQAAQNGGCDFALVRTGKGQKTLTKYPELMDLVPVYDNLATLTDMILQ